MKKLDVKQVNGISGQVQKHEINCNNWAYYDRINAAFSICHDNNCIYLTYTVEEDNVKAVNTQPNAPVYEDSCVEFFLSFDGQYYYNLEFNCIGNILGGYGKEKNKRTELTEDALCLIKTTPSLGSEQIEVVNTPTKWNIEIVIPKEVFEHTDLKKLSGLNVTGNFYK